MTPGRVQFGAFEFDSKARVLSKNGLDLRVPAQSLAILEMLIERAGEVVLREEIISRLWPNGTIVEFEHSINSAVKRLRDALRDNAVAPKFIETLPKRGYRFVAPVRGETRGTPRYRILGEAGRGAMGVVYRAEDLLLKRTVALKSLAGGAAVDAGALDLIVREAQAMAALNHPGICTLYGTDEHDGTPCLVMEFVEGYSLDRRRESLLTGEQVIDIGVQTAAALEAAHNAGVIHRDVKPANILVTNSGQVKLTDFGIAHRDGSARTGAAGTSRYMSPEQAQGLEVDASADVFSLGAVLYELAAGCPHSASDAPSRHNTAISPSLDSVILKALARDPAQRWRSAADLAMALRASSTESGTRQAPGEARRLRRWIAPVAIAAAIGMAGLLVNAIVSSAPDIASNQFRLTPIPAGGRGLWAVWSPDGARIAYAGLSTTPGVWQHALIIQGLSSFQRVWLTQGEAAHPFFSADGSRVYFTAPSGSSRRALWSVSVAGGSPSLILDNLGGFELLDGAAASPDGSALVMVRVDKDSEENSLWVSSPPGAPLTKLEGAPVTAKGLRRAPLRFSPDGTKLLVVFSPMVQAEQEWWLLKWPPPSASVSSPPRRLFANGPVTFGLTSADWLGDNRHLVVAKVEEGYVGGPLWLADTVTEQWQRMSADPTAYCNPRVCRDGRVLVEVVREDEHIVAIPLDGTPVRTLFRSERRQFFPCFAPRTNQLLFVGDERGAPEIWMTGPGGDDPQPVVTQKDLPAGRQWLFEAPEFSPDGKRIAYSAGGVIWVSPVAGGPAVRIAAGSGPTWSADGEWLAYAENEPAASGLVKVRVTEPRDVQVVYRTRTPFRSPRWSPDGKWITTELPGGFGVISPEGKQQRVLRPGKPDWGLASGWSGDGTFLYLAYQDGRERVLARFEPSTGKEHRLLQLGETSFSYLGAACRARLSESPDRRTLVSSVYSEYHEPWLLTGLSAPRSFLSRVLRP
ncbi:MAG: protein kinase [Acidobacteria bacterium]|nr:protein kinase [Acidobacteriota bacterium]